VTLRSTTTSHERRRLVSAPPTMYRNWRINHQRTCPLTHRVLSHLVKATSHYAIQLRTRSQTCVRVSCACRRPGRKLVESQLRTGLRPGSSYISTRPDISNPSATGRKPGLRPGLQCDLNSVMEFGLNPVTLTCDLSVSKQHMTRHCLGPILYRVRSE